MKFFDIFCGAGGLSCGLSKAGFSSIGGLDKYKLAAETYESMIHSKVVLKDAFRLRPEDLKKIVDEADVLAGCPPCQGFSTVKVARFGKEDRRNDLVAYFADLIKVSRPKAVVFENVPPVKNDPRFHYLLNVLRENSYSYAFSVVNAADYGVPQARRRLVLVAVRGVGKVELPEPDHGDPSSEPVKKGILKPWRTVRDAIGDLPPVEAGECHPSDPMHCAKELNPRYIEIIRHVPKDGGSRDAVPDELLLPTHKKHKDSFKSTFGRLWWDRPSVTITTKFYDPSTGRFAHPEQDRGLTLREGARLQTFPDEFVFKGGFTSIARQIGEAFPPLLAEKVGRKIKEFI